MHRETAAAYLKAAGIAFRPPGKWGRASAKPANEVITDFGAELASPAVPPDNPSPGRSPTASACEPYRETIEWGLSGGRNAMAIWQDLVDTCSFAGGYQSVRRFVRKLHPSQSPEARVVIETAVGEECQADYGDGPMVRDPATGKYRRTRLFGMTLGYSRKSVRLLVFHSSSRVWAELHEKAFRRLTGVTRVVVLDNLREGVLSPDVYDPTLNPLYRDVLGHYGAVALPCRWRTHGNHIPTFFARRCRHARPFVCPRLTLRPVRPAALCPVSSSWFPIADIEAARPHQDLACKTRLRLGLA